MRFMHRSSVLLPHPDGPMSAVTLPRRTSRSMSLSAWNEPYQTLRSCTERTVSSEAKLLLRSLPSL